MFFYEGFIFEKMKLYGLIFDGLALDVGRRNSLSLSLFLSKPQPRKEKLWPENGKLVFIDEEKEEGHVSFVYLFLHILLKVNGLFWTFS